MIAPNRLRGSSMLSSSDTVSRTGAEALPALRGKNVRGVTRDQYTPLAVGCCLPGHIGEARNPTGAVHSVVRPVDGDECLADILQGWLAGVFDLLFGQYNPYFPPSARPMPPPPRMPISGSSSISTSAISQLVEGSHPGNSMPVPFRITLRPPSHPTRYCARSDWPSDTSTSTPVSSCAKTRHLAFTIDWHPQFADPGGQYALAVRGCASAYRGRGSRRPAGCPAAR